MRCTCRSAPPSGERGSVLTQAQAAGAGLAAAALAAVAPGPTLVAQGGRGGGGTSGRPHAGPRDAAVGGAQQSARGTRSAASW